MLKASVVGGGLGFIYVASLSLLSPFCTLLFTPFLGVGTGYLAGRFEQPTSAAGGLSRGAVAGSIAGVMAALGQALATMITGVLVTSSTQLPDLVTTWGLSPEIFENPSQYWGTIITLNLFCSTFNIALIGGLAALGGFIWHNRHQNQQGASV